MDTIAAISTAVGNGGIGIIRMSGKESFSILQKIFITRQKQPLEIEKIKGYTIQYGYLIHSKTGEIIDEVLVSFFKAPKSYTKENMCEINSHGGMIIEREILEECISNGASLAEPGEFTKRAFLNGRIDLSQAESIIDIINSKTEKEAKASVNQLEGGLSRQINQIRKDLLDKMADIEASIDYPEYDIEEATNETIKKELYHIMGKIELLEDSFKTGKLLREGIKTAIIGKPNAGKSSLLNYILKEERAIVSDIEGTTRDTIEEMISIKGIPLKIIDTAGIRKTDNKIEEIGVKKALEIAKNADLLLVIFDNTKQLEEEDKEILRLIQGKNAILLLNKIDQKDYHLEESEELKNCKQPIIKISAQKGIGVEEIYTEIEKMFCFQKIDAENGFIISNIRHKTQITSAKNSLAEAISTIEQQLPVDIVAIPIKQCLEDLGKITGENVTEDIINEIFSKFCLGK